MHTIKDNGDEKIEGFEITIFCTLCFIIEYPVEGKDGCKLNLGKNEKKTTHDN